MDRAQYDALRRGAPETDSDSETPFLPSMTTNGLASITEHDDLGPLSSAETAPALVHSGTISSLATTISTYSAPEESFAQDVVVVTRDVAPREVVDQAVGSGLKQVDDEKEATIAGVEAGNGCDVGWWFSPEGEFAFSFLIN